MRREKKKPLDKFRASETHFFNSSLSETRQHKHVKVRNLFEKKTH